MTTPLTKPIHYGVQCLTFVAVQIWRHRFDPKLGDLSSNSSSCSSFLSAWSVNRYPGNPRKIKSGNLDAIIFPRPETVCSYLPMAQSRREIDEYSNVAHILNFTLYLCFSISPVEKISSIHITNQAELLPTKHTYTFLPVIVRLSQVRCSPWRCVQQPADQPPSATGERLSS